MYIDKIPLGINFPHDINVIIEIPMLGAGVKYEIDKESGALCVDRFMNTAMHYPCNYGFVPHTLSGDGDPVDALVLTSYPIIAGAVINVRPIGVLWMEDESGEDEKIITLPTQKAAPEFAHIEDIEGLDNTLKQRIVHFFSHYKDLDNAKWVTIKGFGGKEASLKLLEKSSQKAMPIHC